MFDRLSNGKDVWTRSDTDERLFDRIAQALGITNGQITREQFASYMQQQGQNWGPGGGLRGGGRFGGGPQGAAPGTPVQPSSANPGNGQANARADQRAENMFRRLDANGDGLLSSDEMPDALRAVRDMWDTNKDGFIDLNEYKAYFQAMVQQRMAENGGWPNWQGQGGRQPSSPFPPQAPNQPQSFSPQSSRFNEQRGRIESEAQAQLQLMEIRKRHIEELAREQSEQLKEQLQEQIELAKKNAKRQIDQVHAEAKRQIELLEGQQRLLEAQVGTALGQLRGQALNRSLLGRRP